MPKLYHDIVNGGVFTVEGNRYRKLGRYYLTGGPYPSHPAPLHSWAYEYNYRQVPDLYAILVGDVCDV